MNDIKLRRIEIITDERRDALLAIADDLEIAPFPSVAAKRAAELLRVHVNEITALDEDEEETPEETRGLHALAMEADAADKIRRESLNAQRFRDPRGWRSVP